MGTLKIISKIEAAEIIENACKRGARPITVTTISTRSLLKKSRLNKTPAPFPTVRKVTTLNGIANFSYTKAVNRRLAAAGEPANFEAKGSYYDFLFQGQPSRAIVTHKTKQDSIYLRIKPEKVLSTTLISPSDEVVDPDAIKDFLPLASQNGLDNSAACATLSLENITSFTIDKQSYQIRQ